MSRDPLTGENVGTDRYAGGAAGFWGLPGDLALVGSYTGLAWVLIGFPELVGLSGPPGGVLRVALGLPLLVFLPGYALLAALFPGRPSRNADRLGSLSGLSQRFDTARSIQQRGIQWGERAALSFGLTVFVVPPIALAVDLLPERLFAYDTPSVVAALSMFVLAVSLVGAVRRLRLPRDQRFAVPVGHWFDDLAGGFTGSVTDVVLNAVLLVSILTAAATLGFALAEPNPGSESSTLRLDTGGPSGEPVGGNYTTDFTEGESAPVLVTVVNNEQASMNYTLVVQLQRVEDGTVTQRETLGQFSRANVPNNAEWRVNRTVTPSGLTGENLQMAFLLYEGDPPDSGTLSRENAMEVTSIAVNVTESGG